MTAGQAGGLITPYKGIITDTPGEIQASEYALTCSRIVSSMTTYLSVSPFSIQAP